MGGAELPDPPMIPEVLFQCRVSPQVRPEMEFRLERGIYPVDERPLHLLDLEGKPTSHRKKVPFTGKLRKSDIL